jgi:SanA protein
MVVIPLLFFGMLFCLFLFLYFFTRSRIFSIDKIPHSQYTLVLGAGLEKNGLPTDILADRVKTAANLVKSKKTDFLILSGYSNSKYFCEPESMKTMALSLGIDPSHIVLDFHGKSTFNSCQNLSNLGVKKEVTIVTQNFHLPRSIWLAEAMGYEVRGTPANIYNFSTHLTAYWYLREIIAFPINILKLFIFRLSLNNN